MRHNSRRAHSVNWLRMRSNAGLASALIVSGRRNRPPRQAWMMSEQCGPAMPGTPIYVGSGANPETLPARFARCRWRHRWQRRQAESADPVNPVDVISSSPYGSRPALRIATGQGRVVTA